MPHSHRALWLALILVLALIVAAIAGVLGWLGGQNPPTALLTAGVAFGGTATLATLLLHSLQDRQPPLPHEAAQAGGRVEPLR
ncbi:hypothetical protein [Saccharothrix xinjiangensis]|uniref:Uncharacterized protein n=1 Tax=Saccharothrix xinjiangensis TaxID=204798 RepID=A0ABV9YDV2_9PSEU